MLRILLMAFTLLVFGSTQALAKPPAAPKPQNCTAFATQWPGAGHHWMVFTGCKWGSDLTVVSQGKVLFTLSSLESDDGWVGFEKMGKPKFNKKKNRWEFHFTAVEGAAEYEAPAKAVLFFDGKRWRAVCGQKICEVLPNG